MHNGALATEPHRTLIVPGWQDSGPNHWQSLWLAANPSWSRVQQDDWLRPVRDEWVARLEQTIRADPRPAVLVAHSLGCHLVAEWAAQSDEAQRVRAALLVAPPDTGRADFPRELESWRDRTARPLPFATTVVFSEDDPYCSREAALALAAAWSATPYGIGPRGHINADSALGAWPEGSRLLSALAARTLVR